MIVRNEAAIIERALESVADHIAYWVISDTGSTDETKRLISDFFDDRGIAGEFCDRPFDTFEGARNFALDAARGSAGAFEYILLMDADMQFRVDQPDFRDHLGAPIYAVQQRAGISYWNARLLRRDTTHRYRGVTHEYLEGSGGAPQLAGVWFLDAADGGNRPGKFERDIRLLQGGLEEEPDNARYTYYLAQSYRDAGQLERAAQTYARRFEQGGWDEECWSALLNEARCRLRLGDDQAFEQAAQRAFALRPGRAEPLYDLALFYRQTKQYEAAMMLCELAAGIARPVSDRLFVEDFVYDHGIRQEMSICGFYCSEQRHRDLGRAACNALAIDPTAPKGVRDTARQNLAYYARAIAELLPSWTSHQLEIALPFAGQPTNPSIVVSNGQYRVTVRVVNFSSSNGVDFVASEGEPFATRNLLVDLDAELRPTAATEILAPRDFPAPRFAAVRGLEDMRLVPIGEELVGVATVRELSAAGWCEMITGRLARDENGECRFSDWQVLAPEGERRHEKNWMPRVVADRMQFLYTADPTRILDAAGRTFRESRPRAALDHLRGGSQLVPFDGGWLGLTHEVVSVDGARVYLHRLIWLSEDDELARISEPFHFSGRGVEFAAGLAWHRDGQRLIVSYGLGDRSAWIGTMPASEVRSAIATRDVDT